MVDDKIKPHVVEVNLFNLLVEFSSLENLQGITIDVEHLIRLDLSMATLHD